MQDKVSKIVRRKERQQKRNQPQDAEALKPQQKGKESNTSKNKGVEEEKGEFSSDNEDERTHNVNTKTFQELGLIKPLLKACNDLNYEHATPIQSLAIPAIISGKDVLASSVTGSGKTAAFLLPILQRFYLTGSSGEPGTQNYSKVLIILPTRELAFQCYEMFEKLNQYTKLTACLVIGASSMKAQERLIDHMIHSQVNCEFFFYTKILLLKKS